MKLSRDIGIDLGTANILVYEEGKGIVLREPSVVAVDKNTGKVLQVGAAARNMLGRTPGNIVAVRPLRDGVISDYEMTEKMLDQFLKKISKFSLIKPRVIVCVPSGVTEVEERAVIQATMEAGARRVYLIEEPYAAALGAKLDITGPDGHMVVDIGGGTTDIAVLSLGGIATSSSIKIAGDTFDEAVAAFMRKRYGMIIGLNTAEEVKITIGCVYDRPEEVSMLVKGRDLKTGLPKEEMVSSTELMEAFKRPARQIVRRRGAGRSGDELSGAGRGYCAKRHRFDRRRQPALRLRLPHFRAHRNSLHHCRRPRHLRRARLRQEPRVDQRHAGGYHQSGQTQAHERGIRRKSRSNCI